MWHVMDKLAIQEANAVQRTPCIPEQIADHQENVIITCEDTRNDVVTFLFPFFFLVKFHSCSCRYSYYSSPASSFSFSLSSCPF